MSVVQDFPHPSALRAATFSPEGRRVRVAPPPPKLFPARRLILRALSHVRGSGAPRGAGW
ncbi:hypothetical protein BOS5A_10389 [Bosea sp. EC-HK365B]|nr:hypothetical protein BOSE7B_150453 [Bosea sp. 7B]VVT44189.1 hypothetical protein BOS5A_10389 [Bosea sp. EC-HK365B]VXC42933.1 hypothetical protein BOSE127_190081 [Bosea sp. 127]